MLERLHFQQQCVAAAKQEVADSVATAIKP
jgi:hypothetical protein